MNEVNCSESDAAKRSVFDRVVMRLKSFNPWLIVGWRYCEKDDIGLRVLKSEGATYLWKALVIYLFLLAASFFIELTGIDHPKSDFLIVDA
tara:strand:- start:3085 stop:3357 length:273 start_codon:yes stop_codon:yes gene_type:complete